MAWSAGSLTGSGSFYAAAGPAATTWPSRWSEHEPSAHWREHAERDDRDHPRRRPDVVLHEEASHGDADPHAAITAKAATGGNRRHSTNTVSIPRTLAPAIVATPAPVHTMGLSAEDRRRGSHDPLEHDLRIILAIQSLRAFGYGFASVVLGAALADGGLSDGQVGLVFAAILAGNALVSIAIGLAGDRIGRRRAYVLLLLVMSAAGVAYALSDSVVVLVLVALTGTLSTDANESGPLTSLEQAMLGRPAGGPGARLRPVQRDRLPVRAVGALAGGGRR